jgi:hypothetical protein
MKARDEAHARLDDYVRRNMNEADVDAFEAELFARAVRGESPELAFRRDLGRTLRSMNELGSLRIWLTARQTAELVASGVKVRRFDFDPAKPDVADVSGDFDLLVTRVPLLLEGVEHLEAEVFSSDGKLLKTMPDITFDPADGAIYACCERELAIASAHAAPLTVTRVWSREPSGRRLLLEIGGLG